jgi:hypothetical protein
MRIATLTDSPTEIDLLPMRVGELALPPPHLPWDAEDNQRRLLVPALSRDSSQEHANGDSADFTPQQTLPLHASLEKMHNLGFRPPLSRQWISRKQQSQPARLLVVRSERPQRGGGDDRINA